MNLNRHDAQTDMEMNMTPMIDVVFLLIIFFMIITDLSQKELEQLELPVAQEAVEDKPDPKARRPIVNIDYSGVMKIKKETYFDPETGDTKELEGYLASEADLMDTEFDATLGVDLPDEPLLIRADRVTDFEWLQQVMEICSKEGIRIWKVEIAAAQPEAQAPQE